MKSIKEITQKFTDRDKSFPIDIPTYGALVNLFCESEFISQFLFTRDIFINDRLYKSGDDIEDSFRDAKYLNSGFCMESIVESQLMIETLQEFLDLSLKSLALANNIDPDETDLWNKNELHEICFHILNQVCEKTNFVYRGIINYSGK